MKSTQLLVVLALGSLLLASCARFIMIEPGGGVVAIPSNSGMHRNKAMELMAGKCPGGYDIVREEEVPVGQRITGETSYDPDFESVSREYTVRTKTEWRIRFTCR